MRQGMVRVFVLIAVGGSILFFVTARRADHKLVIKSYFTDALGLRVGAVVRMAGVDVGSVKTVQVRPQAKQEPVEVVMVLTPKYDLRVPNDSTARLLPLLEFWERPT